MTDESLMARVSTLESNLQSHAYRIETVEKDSKSHAEAFTNLRIELTRVDENVKGIREQAKAHSENQTKAMTTMETFFSRAMEEQHKILDRISSALGIDEDIHAAASLRKNLQRLADLNNTRDGDLRAIRNWIIIAVLGTIGVLIILGFRKYTGIV